MTPAAQQSLGSCAFLSDIRVWEADLKTAARRWLTNFNDTERDYAAALLDAFVFFSDTLVDRLFVAAFDALAVEVTDAVATYAQKKGEWQRFKDRVFITHPTGEMPNVTDSGYAFDRRARQQLNIDQAHILDPRDVVVQLSADPYRPVVFVDDFVGSGDQFRNTWHRLYDTPKGTASFSSLAATPGAGPFFYCPLVCTELGKSVIATYCRGLQLRPTHLLPGVYSASHQSSIIWTDTLRPGALNFVETSSNRAGISSGRWWGYANLALAIAFEHGVPDATLPILWWEENGWTPLVRRR